MDLLAHIHRHTHTISPPHCRQLSYLVLFGFLGKTTLIHSDDGWRLAVGIHISIILCWFLARSSKDSCACVFLYVDVCAKGSPRPMSLLWFVRHPQEMVQIPSQSHVPNVCLLSEVTTV